MNVFVSDAGLEDDVRTVIGEHVGELVIASSRERRRYGDGPT